MHNPFILAFMTANFSTGHIIQWKIDPTFKESEPYVYTLEASGTPDFSEIVYTLSAKDVYFLIDDTNFRQGAFNDLYYRVRLDTGDKRTYYSKSILFSSQLETRRMYRLASEISRKELLRLRRYVGVPAYLIKRKPFGQVLQDAVDPISGAPVKNQSTDFGTGIIGGYFHPLKIFISYEQVKSDRKLNESGLGVTEEADISFRAIGYPMIETQDIIADAGRGYRYLVKEVNPVIFPGTAIPIIQQMQASLIPTTDPVYKIKL